MGCIRDKNPETLRTSVFVISMNNEHADQLPMCSCRRLKDYCIHAGQTHLEKRKKMNSLENATLVDHFSYIPGFRCKHNKRHKLVDIMVITICAVIGGANDWNAIETFG